MDTTGLRSLFNRQKSRRDVLKYSGAGIGAATVGTAFLKHTSNAQQATPPASDATPVAAGTGFEDANRTYTMFVQAAQAGTWSPKAGQEGVYTLTLTGLPAQTVYFTDRPSRVVGSLATNKFLDALGFTPNNPPNAALVTSNPDADFDVLVIELFNPVYTEDADATGAQLVYDARILDNYAETGLKDIALLPNDSNIPAVFADASLFIDDCPDGIAICKNSAGETMGAPLFINCCYDAERGGCISCVTVEDTPSFEAEACYTARGEFCGQPGSSTQCTLDIELNCLVVDPSQDV